jgi:hypothetical protein
MNRLVNWFAGTLSLAVILCGDSLSTPALFMLCGFTACMLWLSVEMHKETLEHRYAVSDAPIASQVAKDLKIGINA